MPGFRHAGERAHLLTEGANSGSGFSPTIVAMQKAAFAFLSIDDQGPC
jgi:hypothetical protein